MQTWKPTPKELRELAWQYIEECHQNTKDIATATGVKKVRDRHIPTIAYFLQIWIPLKGKPSICRSTYYSWLYKSNDEDYEAKNDTEKAKMDTIKAIDNVFTALATDIVANEGKGIFYAKNKLGMTDKAQIEQTNKNVSILSNDPLADGNNDSPS